MTLGGALTLSKGDGLYNPSPERCTMRAGSGHSETAIFQVGVFDWIDSWLSL